MNKINLILTHNCNLRCEHCYISAGEENNGSVKILEKTKKMIDFLAENNFSEIMFTGGECTILDEIIEIVKYAKKKEFLVGVFTNGMILKKELFNLVDRVTLSIDGPEKVHNKIRQNDKSFQNLLRTLDYLKSIDKHTTIQYTVNQYNYDKTDFLAELILNHLNIRNFKFEFTKQMGRARNTGLYSSDKFQYTIISLLEKLYEKTDFHVQFKTNLISKYDFKQYYLNENVFFPIWFDLVKDNYYMFENDIKNKIYYEEIISKIKKMNLKANYKLSKIKLGDIEDNYFDVFDYI